MFNISFNPPLGDAVSVPHSSLFTQGTSLLFTAALGRQDYEKLVQRGGRVQLWSDIPRQDGGPNRGWAEMGFEDLSTTSLGMNVVPLKGKPPFQDNATKTLCLLLSLPRSHSGVSRFSFTYRVAYTSGQIEWLGAFGQNGTITMQRSQPSTLDNLHLRTGWRYDQVQNIRVYEIKEPVESLEVAKLDDMSAFRIVGLNPNSFVPNSKNASIFFLVPLLQRHPLVILPTLIVAASHEMTLNLSEHGSLTASGNGAIILQINDVHSDVNANIGRLISHSKLGNWEILSSNSNTTTLTLAETRSNEAIHAITIPLWPSKYIPSNVLLNLGKLGLLSSTHETTDSALFFPGENQLYVLNKDSMEDKDTLLETQPTNNGFIFSPIHRLPIYPTTGRNIRRNWGVVILAPYNRISSHSKEDSTIHSELPKPPRLNPPMEKSIAVISPSSSSSTNATTLCSMTSVSSDIGTSGSTKADLVTDDVGTQQQRTERGDTDVIVPSKALSEQPQTTRDALSLFKSIFVSVTAFARFLFDVLLCPTLPFGIMWFKKTANPVEPENEDPEDDESVDELLEESHVVSLPNNSHVGSPSNPSEGSVRIVPDRIPEDEPRDASQNIDASDSTLFEVKEITSSGHSKDIRVDPDLLVGLDRSSSAEMFYAEVFGKEATGRASFAIAFVPPLATDADNSVTNIIQPVTDLEGALKGAVSFLDGSAPLCTLSRIERSNLLSSCLPGAEHSHDICFLLEYEVDREDGNKVRLISISSPPGSFV